MKKTCTRCNKTFNISMFYKRSSSIDGYRCQCKLCVQDITRVSRNISQRKYANSQKGIDTEKRHSKKRQERVKFLNRDKVYMKVRRKLKSSPCEVCGCVSSQAHHEDYNKPLEVVWLCQKHHSGVHREKRMAYIK